MSVLRKVKSLVQAASPIAPSDHYHEDVSDAYLKVQRRKIARALPKSQKLSSGYDFSW